MQNKLLCVANIVENDKRCIGKTVKTKCFKKNSIPEPVLSPLIFN